MITSDRICENFESLVEFPDGGLSLNLLTGYSCHNSEGPVDLSIALEMQQWFSRQLADFNIPEGLISEATVSIDYRTDHVPSDRNRILLIELKARSRIKTADHTFDSALENIVWCKREALKMSI